ncbi:MAG: hypothetical protein JWO50_447 [Candidatus Kaiserbacteria bacterium]|nr:hypothetical protein [Candidatus Kaiserbacteria bacterium]
MKVMPLEYETRYHLGKRTFIYTFLRYGWWATAIGLGLMYLSWEMYFGALRSPLDSFLTSHRDWYIDSGMLSEWTFLASISFIFIGLLRGWVMYRQHTFMVDRHAFHLRRGLFRTRETRIPYMQISNIEIERPYHFRIFGLAQLDVTISSGDRDTGRSAESRAFLIPLIDAKLAHSLSHHIIRHGSNRIEAELDYKEDDEDEEDGDISEKEETDDFTMSERDESKKYIIYPNN